MPRGVNESQRGAVVQFEIHRHRNRRPSVGNFDMEKPTVPHLRIMHEANPYGLCESCGAKFTGARDEIKRQFDQHDCKPEDFSQAAARIVREATENR